MKSGPLYHPMCGFIETVGGYLLSKSKTLRHEVPSDENMQRLFYSSLRWLCFRFLNLKARTPPSQMTLSDCLDKQEHKEAKAIKVWALDVLDEPLPISIVIALSSLQVHDIASIGQCVQALLSIEPEIDPDSCVVRMNLLSENRKFLGAYFTPPRLVECILDEVLEPLLFEHRGSIEALENLRICDPSCGSGYFLVAAALRIAQAISALNPSVSHSKILEGVLRSCVYGVDVEPLCVEATRLSLGVCAKTHIAQLEQHIVCGNALLFASEKWALQGINNQHLLTLQNRDSAESAKRIRSRNRNEVKNGIIKQKYTKGSALLSDLVLASVLCPKTKEFEQRCPTHNAWHSLVLKGQITKRCLTVVETIRTKHRFCQWSFMFPDVFDGGGFDAVIGNPPFLDSTYLKKNHPDFRYLVSLLYDSAKGNWDIYIPFVELGLRLLKRDGRLGFVTPNKIFASDYAEHLQALLFERFRLLCMHDFSEAHLFDGAQVPVVVTIAQSSEAKPNMSVNCVRHEQNKTIKTTTTIDSLSRLPKGYISFPLSKYATKCDGLLQFSQQLSELASVSDGASTAEAYKIRELVEQETEPLNGQIARLKLINTGTIDPFVRLWGEKSIRYLGFRGTQPVINPDSFAERFPRRYAQTMKDTVVIGGMGARLEAVVAPSGFVCGKSAVLIQPNAKICPYALTLILNLKQWSILYRGLFGFRGLGESCMNIGPRQVEQLPMPPSEYLELCPKEKLDFSMANHIPESQRFSWFGYQLHQPISVEAHEKLYRSAESHMSVLLKRYTSIQC